MDPKPNHMTSFLSLVVIADTVDDDARRAVRKVRFRKNFKWGLRGWADLRLAVADLSRGDVVSKRRRQGPCPHDRGEPGTVTSPEAASGSRGKEESK